MKTVHKTAIVGIMTALEIAAVYVFGLIPGLSVIGPILAGFLLVFLRDVAGALPSYITYAVTGILLFLISPRKFAAIVYVVMFGYYPILFADLAKIKQIVLRAVVKALYFEGIGAAALAVAKYVIGFDSFHMMDSFASRGITVHKAVAAAIVLYQILVGIYEFFLWGYYKKYNEKIKQRLQSVFIRK